MKAEEKITEKILKSKLFTRFKKDEANETSQKLFVFYVSQMLSALTVHIKSSGIWMKLYVLRCSFVRSWFKAPDVKWLHYKALGRICGLKLVLAI